MLDELKLKLKELAELRRDMQNSTEYLEERRVEYEATEAYKHYAVGCAARKELFDELHNLEDEIKQLFIGEYKQHNIHINPEYFIIDFDNLSQYLDGG